MGDAVAADTGLLGAGEFSAERRAAERCGETGRAAGTEGDANASALAEE